jgi:hypothetical protein
MAAIALLLVGGSSTSADCSVLSAWPSFRETAPSARRITVGTVIETSGGDVNNVFTLRVDEVLRGSEGPSVLHFRAFRSGAPQPICPGDSVLRVRDIGERLAFAYGAQLAGFPPRITSVAFVSPSKPDRDLLPRMERLTISEVRAIAAEMPPTEAVPTARSGDPDLLPTEMLILLLALGTGVYAFRRLAAAPQVVASSDRS